MKPDMASKGQSSQFAVKQKVKFELQKWIPLGRLQRLN